MLITEQVEGFSTRQEDLVRVDCVISESEEICFNEILTYISITMLNTWITEGWADQLFSSNLTKSTLIWSHKRYVYTSLLKAFYRIM